MAQQFTAWEPKKQLSCLGYRFWKTSRDTSWCEFLVLFFLNREQIGRKKPSIFKFYPQRETDFLWHFCMKLNIFAPEKMVGWWSCPIGSLFGGKLLKLREGHCLLGLTVDVSFQSSKVGVMCSTCRRRLKRRSSFVFLALQPAVPEAAPLLRDYQSASLNLRSAIGVSNEKPGMGGFIYP